jgi:hypothetical protein
MASKQDFIDNALAPHATKEIDVPIIGTVTIRRLKERDRQRLEMYHRDDDGEIIPERFPNQRLKFIQESTLNGDGLMFDESDIEGFMKELDSPITSAIMDQAMKFSGLASDDFEDELGNSGGARGSGSVTSSPADPAMPDAT